MQTLIVTLVMTDVHLVCPGTHEDNYIALWSVLLQIVGYGLLWGYCVRQIQCETSG